MKYKFYHIPALSPDQATAELNQFCAQHHILKTERAFVADGSNSFWSVCVLYSDDTETPAGKEGRKNRVDYKEVLSTEDFMVYSELRDLRKQIAEREGCAVYNVFTNDQLAAMVQQRTTSKHAMQEIKGIGSARLEKFGDEFVMHLLTQFAFTETELLPADEA